MFYNGYVQAQAENDFAHGNASEIQDNMTYYACLKDAQDILGTKRNFVFQGENEEIMHSLLPYYRERVDVILTDPPYNVSLSGNYRDSFTEAEWKEFISVRFSLAYDFLKQDGYMFVHIADETYPLLRMILDGIFGSKSYIGTIIQDKKNAQNDARDIQCNHDFICVYKKNPSDSTTELYTISDKKVRVYRDRDGRFWYRGAAITTGGMGGILERRTNLGYSVYVSADGTNIVPVDDYDHEKALYSNVEDEVYYDNFELPNKIDGCKTTKELIAHGYRRIRAPKKGNKLGCWTWGIETFLTRIDEIHPSDSTMFKKIYVNANEVFEENEKFFYTKKQFSPSKSIISFASSDGTKQLTKITGESRLFSNPKNVEMELYLISLFHRKSEERDGITVLDFFAGSGTTAQAAYMCNKRNSFIMITNNEVEKIKRQSFLKQKGIKENEFDSWLTEHREEWENFAMKNGNCSYVLRSRLDNIQGLEYDYVKCD